MKSKIRFYLILLTLLASFIPAVQAQTYSVIHTFTGGTDGAAPFAGVTIRGNSLYGTAAGPICGTVYQLTHTESNWLFSTLLASHPNNCEPRARVVFGPDGHLYGTTWVGGTYYDGTVFKLTPQIGPCKDAACYWTANDLHGFGSGTDGSNPYLGDLIWDQQGNIYGTTVNSRGVSNCYLGCGIVYELTPSEDGYTESVLYSFSGSPDGAKPYAGLVFDNKGNLFGTTYEGGGSNDFGTVFELTYVPGVGWTEKVLYNFQLNDGGVHPEGGLIFDAAGNLYGTTSDGLSGRGAVFELSPSGDTWKLKLLYNADGGSAAGLSMDGAGNLFGTTMAGGIYGGGTVFKLSNTENGWVHTSLHDFKFGDTGGNLPMSNVSIDTDGTLYGTTGEGGDLNCSNGYGCGVVWMIKP